MRKNNIIKIAKRVGSYNPHILPIVFCILVTITFLACNNEKDPPKEMPEMELEEEIDIPSLMNDSYYRGRIELIRNHIDSFLCGYIENPVLEPYKSIVQRDFHIIDLHVVMGGGVYFRIIFPHYPEDVFQVFTSIDVEDGTERITAFHLGEFKKVQIQPEE